MFLRKRDAPLLKLHFNWKKQKQFVLKKKKKINMTFDNVLAEEVENTQKRLQRKIETRKRKMQPIGLKVPVNYKWWRAKCCPTFISQQNKSSLFWQLAAVIYWKIPLQQESSAMFLLMLYVLPGPTLGSRLEMRKINHWALSPDNNQTWWVTSYTVLCIISTGTMIRSCTLQ